MKWKRGACGTNSNNTGDKSIKLFEEATGRQLFEDAHKDIINREASQLRASLNGNHVAHYQSVLKAKWEALTEGEQANYNKLAQDQSKDIFVCVSISWFLYMSWPKSVGINNSSCQQCGSSWGACVRMENWATRKWCFCSLSVTKMEMSKVACKFCTQYSNFLDVDIHIIASLPIRHKMILISKNSSITSKDISQTHGTNMLTTYFPVCFNRYHHRDLLVYWRTQ
jgi:hypothetical protein